MRDSFNKLIKEAKKVTLTTSEKGLIEGRLVAFMGTLPVRDEAVGRRYYQRSTVSSIITTLKKMPIITIATILALMGGGTAYAAQGSLPGDLLYPVKINIDEKVEEFTAVSTAAKAQVESQLAIERLQEGEELYAEGKLNSTNEAELESNFETHANNESSLVGQLEVQGNLQAATQVNSNFESELSAHQDILNILNINVLDQNTKAEIQASENTESNLNQQVTAGSAAEVSATVQANLNDVNNAIDQANLFLNENKNRIEGDVFAQAQLEVGNASTTVAEANTKIVAGDYANALVLLQQAQQSADKAVVDGQASLKLNLGAILNDTSSTAVQSDNVGVSSTTVNNTTSGGGQTSTGTKTTTTDSGSASVNVGGQGTISVPSVPTGSVSGSAGGSGGINLGL